jgi:hypothetical protein
MYRVGRLFAHLEYTLALPLVATLLFRNFMYVLFVVHWSGCAVFFIARQGRCYGGVRDWLGSL